MKKKFVLLASLSLLTGVSVATTLTSCSVVEHLVDKVTINNKEDLTATWHTGEKSRSIDVSTDPVENIPALIQQKKLVVESSDTNVVTVSGTTIYAQGAGKATVTVRVGDASDSVEITITDLITLIPTNDVISLGASDKTVSFAIESTGEKTALTDFDWTSSDTAVATVKDGVVTGVKAGKTTITCTEKGNDVNKGTYEITVVEGNEVITAISDVNDSTIQNEITVDGEVVAQTTQGFLLSDGPAAIYVYLKADPSAYEIGDHVKVRTVTKDGKVTGVSTYNGLPQFTADADIVPLSSKSGVTVPEATALTPEIANSFTSDKLTTKDIKKYKWTTVSSKQSGGYTTLNIEGSDVDLENSYTNEDLFKIEPYKYYDVEAYFGGYSSGNAYAAMYITGLEEKEVTTTMLTIGKSQMSGFVGNKLTLTTGIVTPEGTEKPEVTFSSNDESVATVKDVLDTDGKKTGDAEITLLKVGEAEITVKAGDLTKTCKITVQEAVGEPDIQFKSLKEIIAADDTNGKCLYITEGEVVESKGDQYGNLYLMDDDGNKIQVYGTTASISALEFDMEKKQYSFSNPKDFQTNEDTKAIKNGDKIKVAAIRADYKDTKEISVVVLAINDRIISNGTATTDDFYNKTVKSYATYTVEGKIESYYNQNTDFTDFGNFMLKSANATNAVTVYGATATATALKFDSKQEKVYYFSNPKDFMTNEKTKNLKIGDTIKIMAIYDEYNGTPQMKGIIL